MATGMHWWHRLCVASVFTQQGRQHAVGLEAFSEVQCFGHLRLADMLFEVSYTVCHRYKVHQQTDKHSFYYFSPRHDQVQQPPSVHDLWWKLMEYLVTWCFLALYPCPWRLLSSWNRTGPPLLVSFGPSQTMDSREANSSDFLRVHFLLEALSLKVLLISGEFRCFFFYFQKSVYNTLSLILRHCRLRMSFALLILSFCSAVRFLRASQILVDVLILQKIENH